MEKGGMLLLIGLLGWVSACNSEEKIDTIDDPVMVQVLTDIHVADAILQDVTRGDLKDSLYVEYYERIFRQNGVTRTQFEQTIENVRRDPEKLNQLYTEVLDELARRDALLKD
jgi:hypothetical protein